jgi:pimeloyl-ACP methyl ester carboxylesterase
MTELAVGDGTIHFEERGSGPPVVLTPGGMWGGYIHRVVATELAKDFRVITWDRRNSDGKSSIVMAGDQSEADIWADDLATLIKTLGISPCYVGEYAGCRTTPLLCLKYPDLVKGLMLAWPSGGEAPVERLPKTMFRPYIRAALRRGMQGVVDLNFPTGRDARAEQALEVDAYEKNPGNRECLLAMQPLQFVRQMAFWEAFFNTSADLPVAGCRATTEDWASIKVPAVVTGGVDPIHPTAAAQWIHRLLLNSRYHDPVVTQTEWNALFGKVPYPKVADLQGERIAPVWRSFMLEMEDRTAGG